jgi:hypothetical protein
VTIGPQSSEKCQVMMRGRQPHPSLERRSESKPRSQSVISLTRQRHVLLIHQHLVPLWPELGPLELGNGLPGPSEPDEFGAIEACRVVQHAGTIDNGDGLVL